MKRTLYILLAILAILLASTAIYSSYIRRIKLSNTIPEIDKSRNATTLTAFFGLDALPMPSLLLYINALGKNGIPVTFSEELDPATMDNSNFEVTSKNGEKFGVEFVTLKPANEEFELRTALLIGEYGTHPDNPPVTVTIVGDLLSRSGQNLQRPNYAGDPAAGRSRHRLCRIFHH